jgi:hypothetical protein
VFKGRTVDGIPIEIENLNSASYNGPKIYAVVNGKKHLVREFSTHGEEMHYVANDKTAKQLGVNLKPTQNLPPEDIQNITARGFKPDPETPFHHEFTDPVRYNQYNTTGVDPKGVWKTDLARANTYKEKQAQAAAKKAPKDVLEMKTGEEIGDRAAFDKANLLNKVASRPSIGSYREGNKIITVTAVDTGNWPLPPGRVPPTTARAVDAVTGERVPVGKTWTADDPEPLGAKVRRKLKRD